MGEVEQEQENMRKETTEGHQLFDEVGEICTDMKEELQQLREEIQKFRRVDAGRNK